LDADVKRGGSAIRGKLALVKNGGPMGGRPEHRLQKYARVKEAGAAAFLFVDDQPGMLPPTGSLVFVQDGPLDQALPSVGIPYEAGQELARWARNDAVLRLRLRLDNRLWRAESWNVAGELPGQAPDAPFIVVGGHLDGHDIAQGAIDNASGVVAITEIARALAALGAGAPPFAHTIRFLAFGAEELGMLGSHAYVEQHLAELDRLRFVFNLDCVGTGHRVGFGLQDCGELAPYFREMGQALAADLDVGEYLVPFSDQFPFTLRGLPSAFIHTAGDRGVRGWGHTSADTLDKVSVQAIRLAAATVARMVLRVAVDEDAWPGRRRTPDEVKATLQAQGAEPLMRAQQNWPFA
jgi:Zn-dependent M28 family amino/carboxypeptidase